MYSLIIVEDELAVRRGLVNMVGWNELGFQVDGEFSDGAELMDYLKVNIPDVILTDVKMRCVSGIEVAQYVAENGLPIQIVFLTGHKNFEFAQNAVEYSVAYYLLKPISIHRIREVFSNLRDKLDKQNILKDAQRNRENHYNMLMNYEKQQFVTEIYFGSLRDNKKIEQRMRLFNTGIEEGRTPEMFFLKVVFRNDAQYAGLLLNCGMQEMQDRLLCILECIDSNLEFYPILWSTGKEECLSVLGVFWKKIKKEECIFDKKDIDSNKECIKRSIFDLTSISTEVPILAELKSAKELILYAEQIGKGEKSDDLIRDVEYLQMLREQNKLLYSYICEGKFVEIKELSQGLFSNYMRAGIFFAQQQCLFSIIRIIDSLVENDCKERVRLSIECRISEIFSCIKSEDLEAWFVNCLSIIYEFAGNYLKVEKNSSINKVMDYIKEHYSEDISLTEIAEKVYLNPVYVSRLIKEQIGKSYTELIIEYRIEKAVELLDNTKLHIYEIAEKVGYQNLKHFYNVFKKVKGVSPGEYKKRLS